jgi:TRAP-type C4-dicarboxylate transport system permease small subunit
MFGSVRQKLTYVLEILVIITMGVLVLDVLWGVISRFVLGAQSRWTEELATMLLIWASLLGAGAAFGDKGHLGVDYFVKKLHPDAQKIMTVVITFVVGFFAGAVMVYGGYELVSKTLASGQVSPAMGLPIGYVYLAVPISGLFVLLYCVEDLVNVFQS